MSSAGYKPGETVPLSGIYRIEHHSYRMMHHLTLAGGMRFPLCKRCGIHVRFFPLRSVPGEVIPFRETRLLVEFPERRKRLRVSG